MANIYRNAFFDLTGTNKTTVFTCPVGSTVLVKTIQITNISGGNVEVEGFIVDTSASSAEFEFVHDTIPTKTFKNLASGTIVLEESDILKLKAGSGNTLAGTIGYLEINRSDQNG